VVGCGSLWMAVDNPSWTLTFAPIPVRKRRENETGTAWAREAAGAMSPLINRLGSLSHGLGGQLLRSAVGAAIRDLGEIEVPTEPGGLEFILKASGLQVLSPPLETVLRLPWNPEEPNFAGVWERVLLRHGLPVPLAPADFRRFHVVIVPTGLLSCTRLLLGSILAAAEGRPDALRTVVAHFELAPGALKFLPHLVDPGVCPEDLVSVDPTTPELQLEDLTTLAVAAIAREGSCEGFLSMVHRGASRFLSPPTWNRQILAWGWYPYLALVLATETPQRRCRRCGAPLPEGRRLYCSIRCSNTMRKSLYRARQRAINKDLITASRI
jgi:predicted nucleic acid-binding Zn ribbon protein